MFKKKDQKLADSVIQKDVQCTGFIRAVKDETKNAPVSVKQSNDTSLNVDKQSQQIQTDQTLKPSSQKKRIKLVNQTSK